MTTAIKRRRGTTVQHSTFTGLEGEITVDTTKDTLVVHDGATAGGFPLAKDAEVVHLTGTETVEGTKTLSSNPILSAGTANGVTYLNGSKVLTSGSALTFDGTNFAVGASPLSGVKTYIATQSGNSTVRLDCGPGGVSTSDLTFGAYGFSAVAGLRFEDANSLLRMYGDATRVLAFNANGSEQMRLTSTGLGIGTSSPPTKIEVRGAGATVAGISGVVGGIFENSANATTAPQGALTLGAAYTGTTPTVYAYVAGAKENAADGNFAGALIFGSRPNGGNLTERMRLDSSGNLGLGVTPSAWGTSYKAFQLGAGASAVGVGSDMYLGQNWYADAGGNKYIATAAAGLYALSAGAHKWYTAPSGTAGNAISFTQAMTLTASGNLLVGGTSGSQKLTVVGNLKSAGAQNSNVAKAIFTRTDASWSINNETDLRFYVGTGDTDSPATVVASMTSSGNLLVGTTTAGASKLVVNSDSIQVNIAKTPASATATGTTGQIAWDSGYIYVCVATNTWKRSAIATW